MRNQRRRHVLMRVPRFVSQPCSAGESAFDEPPPLDAAG